MRFDVWKFVFMEQKISGTLQVWSEPYTQLRFPKIFNLKTDPFEIADKTSNTYWDWVLEHAFLVAPIQELVKKLLNTFDKFPRRKNGTTWAISELLKQLDKNNNAK